MSKTLSFKEDCLIGEGFSIKEAMQRMGKVAMKILFVVDEENKLLGSLSDEDIREWVLSDGNLLAPIEKIYNRDPLYMRDDHSVEDVKQVMLEKKIEWIPVISRDKKFVKVLMWNQVFGNGQELVNRKIDIPVVIMAGGKGTRLDPLTRILPKPLVPIGEKTVFEVIMEKFHRFGVDTFYLSINHKSHIIRAYFEELKHDFNIEYIEETKPLGTVGSLKLMEEKIKGPILVSNCDVIIDGDYAALIDFHKRKNNDITLVGSFRHYQIPYGVCRIEDGGTLIDIDEKPEYDFLANTGMYVLEDKVLNFIPRDQAFDMPELIKCVKDQGGKVGVFPVDEKSWIDVGQLDEYRKVLKKFENN